MICLNIEKKGDRKIFKLIISTKIKKGQLVGFISLVLLIIV